MTLTPSYIAANVKGLQRNKKPFLIPSEAFQTLENAYCWREQTKKREGLRLLGRLRRRFTSLSLGVSGASPWTFTIWTTLVPAIVPEATAEIEPGSVVITIGASIFTDQGDGTLTLNGTNFGIINYLTGVVTLTHTAGAGVATTITFNYFPGLPAMGIWDREIVGVNDEQEIFFDTKYAYIFVGTGFQEFPTTTATTWAGSDANFFWTANYRGSTAETRYFFVTNFVVPTVNPMRYYNPAITDWVTFQPLVADVPESAAASYLFQAKILIPYYGRLLALNVYEGASAAGAVNIFNRCRFSHVGDPTAVDAWRSDQFGKGGFIDAPVNEDIISATFFKNTLIVGFEGSTWQLRYVGEYGLPFIWERISSDFGCESQFSAVLFDQGVLQVGDKGIVSSESTTVQRIDLDIPDIVFDNFHNAQNGTARIWGIRDFQREIVYWCYSDADFQRKFPNKSLIYNYRNNTWAIFRNNVTCFGTFLAETAITWDSLDIFWDSDAVTWNDNDTQSLFPLIVSGNQQGFIHYYNDTTQDEPSLSITAIDLTVTPITITVTNHNIEDNEIIYITDLAFLTIPPGNVPVATDLNDNFYNVLRVDANTLSLFKWDGTNYVNNFTFTPAAGTANYVGGGRLTLFPKMSIITKDFNPYQERGQQFKLSYVDFLTDVTDSGVVSVTLYANSSQSFQANMIVGNTQNETYANPSFYVPNSEYTWHRFFATLAAQFIRIQITYDDDLMNQLSTHQQNFVLNAMTLWTREGSRTIF